GSLKNATAPASEQGFHSIQNRQVVVDAQNRDSGKLHAVSLPCHALLLTRWYDRRERDLDREQGSATDRRADDNFVVENAGDALHDRKAQSQAAGGLGPLIEPMKFLKNCLLRRSRTAEPGRGQIEAQPAVAAPAAQKHAALERVFNRVRDEILQQPPQQTPIGLDRQRAGHELEA